MVNEIRTINARTTITASAFAISIPNSIHHLQKAENFPANHPALHMPGAATSWASCLFAVDGFNIAKREKHCQDYFSETQKSKIKNPTEVGLVLTSKKVGYLTKMGGLKSRMLLMGDEREDDYHSELTLSRVVGFDSAKYETKSSHRMAYLCRIWCIQHGNATDHYRLHIG